MGEQEGAGYLKKTTDRSQIIYSGYTSTDHLSLQGIVSSDDWWKISQMYLENHI